MDKENKFYVTTPIYYTSGKPHLGHAYTSIAVDVIARWNKNIGKEVLFATGTDEHGLKIQKKAKENNMEPQEFVDSLIPYFKEQLKILNIDYDYFIRTTNQQHKKFVQKMLQKSYDNGDIYKGIYEGLYCIDCEQYYKKEELINEKICPIHKKKVSQIKEENYFFKLSKYENKLLELYKNNENFLSPKSKAQETINRVKDGLEDISISRNKKSLDWGIELPFDKNHTTYVWFDALFNYLSTLEINKKQNFWPANIHIVGKDIMWFHKVYWPAFLMSVGYEIPKKVFAHGWWTVNGEKMGKTIGNIIDPIEIVKKYGVDEFRFFVLASGSFGEDQNFTKELFIEKINNELNNDLGNLVSRVHAMTNQYFSGNVPNQEKLEESEIKLINSLNIFKKFNEKMQNLQFNKAIETLFTAIRETNTYINKVTPWKEQDTKRLASIINTLNFAIKTFANYIDCFMPTKAQKIREQFNFEKEQNFPNITKIKNNHKLGEKENLFQKIKLEKPKSNNIPQKKEGLESLNLKSGKIISVEQIENSDKLYKLKVDIGENQPRQILSGLKEIYLSKDLENKKVIVLTNLKTAKLAGEISQGMILAVEDKNYPNNCSLLTTTLEIGKNIKTKNITADNKKTIKINNFKKVKIIAKNGKIYYNDQQIENTTDDKKYNGYIC
ncbi:MAG: methionine--tRNA ligase [Nanoarchaeota archaeon]